MGAWLSIGGQLPSLCKALGLGGRGSWASEMVHMVKAFTAKPEYPSQIPESHMVKENQLQTVLCPVSHSVAHAHLHPIQNKYILFFFFLI